MSSANRRRLSWTLCGTHTNLAPRVNRWWGKSLGSEYIYPRFGLKPNTHDRFWELAIKTLSPTAQRRFIDTFDLYTASVVQQAEDRTHAYIRSIDSYLMVRRDTIGAKPSFALLEADMNLPDEVINHPVIVDLSISCIDMLILGNVSTIIPDWHPHHPTDSGD